jgi:hypothetical protein
MAKPENTEFKKTTVVYVLTEDFNYSNTLISPTIAVVLTKGTELRKGITAWPTQGGLKWGDHLIPDGTFETFHETETVKTTFTRRRGKG